MRFPTVPPTPSPLAPHCFWVNIFWGSKFFWIQSVFGSTSFGVKIFWEVKQILGSKFLGDKKNFDSEFFQVKNIFGSNFFVQKIFWVRIKLSSKILGSTFFWGQKNFWVKKISGQIFFTKVFGLRGWFEGPPPPPQSLKSDPHPQIGSSGVFAPPVGVTAEQSVHNFCSNFATLGPSWNFSLTENLASLSLQDGPWSGTIISKPASHPVAYFDFLCKCKIFQQPLTGSYSNFKLKLRGPN